VWASVERPCAGVLVLCLRLLHSRKYQRVAPELLFIALNSLALCTTFRSSYLLYLHPLMGFIQPALLLWDCVGCCMHTRAPSAWANPWSLDVTWSPTDVAQARPSATCCHLCAHQTCNSAPLAAKGLSQAAIQAPEAVQLGSQLDCQPKAVALAALGAC
jgi:hypothetical protein